MPHSDQKKFNVVDRVSNRHSTWYLINIKARRYQSVTHYVDVFSKLKEEKPEFKFLRGGKYGRIKSVLCSEILGELNEPQWIKVTMVSYTEVDKTAFFNKRQNEDVVIDNWNDDIVVNKNETELYFIPSKHVLALKCNSKISLNNVKYYLEKALNSVEEEMFDVDIIVEKSIITRILSAHKLYSIEANISYSNGGHTSGFEEAFGTKLRDTGGEKSTFKFRGTDDNPLNKEKDGLISAVVNLSEKNGVVKAVIKDTEHSKKETINTSEHPKKLIIPQIVNDIASTIYNYLKTKIH